MEPLLIRNGLITTHNRQFSGDIFITNGQIAKIGRNLTPKPETARIIDADGKLILPGGVDPHVHLSLPSGNHRSSDDFESGTMAAIAGGTTTLIDFVTPEKGESLFSALKKRKKQADKALCDYSLHMSITSVEALTADDIRRVIVEEGITTFKLYMAYRSSVGLPDEDILKAMDMIRNAGGIAMIHCENGDAEAFLSRKMIREGRTSIRHYPESRPAEMERDAVDRAIFFSGLTGCPLYIVHLTTETAVERVLEAKKRGLHIYAETCPHYLLIDDSVYDGREGAKYIMSPPLRKKHDISMLWEGLNNGTLEVISTDHCPFNSKISPGPEGDDFNRIPKGVGGVDHRLKLIWSEGVAKGILSVTRFVNLVSTRPAKIFGLFPRKGTIMKGSDADLVIWDPEASSVIHARNQYHSCDTTVYENVRTTGAPAKVILGGQVIFDNGLFDLSRARGNFIYRNR